METHSLAVPKGRGRKRSAPLTAASSPSKRNVATAAAAVAASAGSAPVGVAPIGTTTFHFIADSVPRGPTIPVFSPEQLATPATLLVAFPIARKRVARDAMTILGTQSNACRIARIVGVVSPGEPEWRKLSPDQALLNRRRLYPAPSGNEALSYVINHSTAGTATQNYYHIQGVQLPFCTSFYGFTVSMLKADAQSARASTLEEALARPAISVLPGGIRLVANNLPAINMGVPIKSLSSILAVAFPHHSSSISKRIKFDALLKVIERTMKGPRRQIALSTDMYLDRLASVCNLIAHHCKLLEPAVWTTLFDTVCGTLEHYQESVQNFVITDMQVLYVMLMTEYGCIKMLPNQSPAAAVAEQSTTLESTWEMCIWACREYVHGRIYFQLCPFIRSDQLVDRRSNYVVILHDSLHKALGAGPAEILWMFLRDDIPSFIDGNAFIGFIRAYASENIALIERIIRYAFSRPRLAGEFNELPIELAGTMSYRRGSQSRTGTLGGWYDQLRQRYRTYCQEPLARLGMPYSIWHRKLAELSSNPEELQFEQSFIHCLLDNGILERHLSDNTAAAYTSIPFPKAESKPAAAGDRWLLSWRALSTFHAALDDYLRLLFADSPQRGYEVLYSLVAHKAWSMVYQSLFQSPIAAMSSANLSDVHVWLQDMSDACFGTPAQQQTAQICLCLMQTAAREIDLGHAVYMTQIEAAFTVSCALMLVLPHTTPTLSEKTSEGATGILQFVNDNYGTDFTLEAVLQAAHAIRHHRDGCSVSPISLTSSSTNLHMLNTSSNGSALNTVSLAASSLSAQPGHSSKLAHLIQSLAADIKTRDNWQPAMPADMPATPVAMEECFLKACREYRKYPMVFVDLPTNCSEIPETPNVAPSRLLNPLASYAIDYADCALFCEDLDEWESMVSYKNHRRVFSGGQSFIDSDRSGLLASGAIKPEHVDPSVYWVCLMGFERWTISDFKRAMNKLLWDRHVSVRHKHPWSSTNPRLVLWIFGDSLALNAGAASFLQSWLATSHVPGRSFLQLSLRSHVIGQSGLCTVAIECDRMRRKDAHASVQIPGLEICERQPNDVEPFDIPDELEYAMRQPGGPQRALRIPIESVKTLQRLYTLMNHCSKLQLTKAPLAVPSPARTRTYMPLSPSGQPIEVPVTPPRLPIVPDALIEETRARYLQVVPSLIELEQQAERTGFLQRLACGLDAPLYAEKLRPRWIQSTESEYVVHMVKTDRPRLLWE